MGIMKQEDLQVLERHFIKYYTFVKSQYITNFNKEVYNELIGIYTEYVSKKNNFSHWCSSCRVDLIVKLYTWYISSQPNGKEWEKAQIEKIEGKKVVTPIVEVIKQEIVEIKQEVIEIKPIIKVKKTRKPKK
jgi:hypothetical protein